MKNLTRTLIAMLAILKLAAKEPIAPNEAKQLLFIENKGQITDQYKEERKDIDFKLDGGGVSIFVGDGQIHYQWYQYTGNPGDSNMQVNAYRIDVKLVGANLHAQLKKEEANNYYENYYSSRLKDGVTAKSYRRMVYKNIYPQIDWVIYTKGQELKYDFVVHKGGNPADIRLQYNGATSAELKNGAFTATTPMGSITEEAPYSYEADTKRPVASAYKLQDGVLGFDVVKQDADIVIDPNLIWATYFGGINIDFGYSIAADDSGYIYSSGVTSSATNIATTGAFRTTIQSNPDRYVACFNENCAIQWSTYLGIGPANHSTYGTNEIAIDTARNCFYVTGATNDTVGVTTSGVHQMLPGGLSDVYLAKFNFNGFRLWCTYYGGSGDDDVVSRVETDSIGNVFLFGVTTSLNNISTTGAYLSAFPYNPSQFRSCFLAKFNSAGARQWGTYLCIAYHGNTFPGSASALATDIAGNVYVAGRAVQGVSAGTVGTHSQYSIDVDNDEDIWLGKYTANGSLSWGTFYGGQEAEGASSLTVSANGDVYMGGFTRSDTGIATSTGFRTVRRAVNANQCDGFIAKFNNLGKRVWGTYIGDSSLLNAYNNDVGCMKMLNDKRIAFTMYSKVAVLTAKHEFVTSNAFQPIRSSLADLVVGVFDTAGNRIWGSFFGGNSEDGFSFGGTMYNAGLAKTDKYLYLSGMTSSNSMLSYGSGIYQSGNAGFYDVFIAQISLDTIIKIIQPFTDTVLCPGDSVKVKTKINFPFRSTNVFTVQLSNANGSFASPTFIGTKTANGNDSVMCFVPRTMPAGNGYRIRIITSAPADTSDDNGKNIRIKPLPTAVVASSNAPICATDTLRLSGSSGNTDVTYSWAGVAGFASGVKDTFRAAATTAHTGNYILTVNRQGCIVKDTTYVLVKPRPDTPDASSNSPVCTGATINLTGNNVTSGVSYVWNGPAGFGSTLQSPTRTGAITSHSGIYRVYTSLNGCASLMYDSTSVTVYPVTALPVASANTPLCLGQDLQLVAGTIPGASYVWSGPGGYNSTLQNPLRTASTSAFAGKYYVQAIVNGCISSPDSITVTVNAAPSINMYPSPKDSICVGQSVTFVSNASNAGSSYTRSWFKNNNVIGGAANANYSTTTAADGDEYYITLTAYGVCATPYTDTSNIIRMHVLPWLAPSVSISANPNTTVTSGTMINFTATPTNGGNTPKYQWTRNGTNITGAISNIWGASTLSNNDQICVDMTSNYLCPNPKTAKSNCIKVSIESTGIVGVWSGATPSIYPNPTKDKLLIEGIEKGTIIQLNDVFGRVVIKATAANETAELNMSHLAAGSYMLLLSKDNGDRMSVKVVKE